MKLKNFRIPDWTAGEMTPAHGQMVLQYMKERAAANKTADEPTVVAYTHGAAIVSSAYLSAIMNIDMSRIYFIPYKQATHTIWHYIDVASGAVVAYSHGVTCVNYAYQGGVLARDGRIYLVPNSQSTATTWHYIDTNGTVVAYTHGVTDAVNSYIGGCLAPNGRIYLCPATLTNGIDYYINTDGTVASYTHGVTSSGTYRGGVLDANGRIYLIPNTQTTADVWHYIDTSNDTIVAYTRDISVIIQYSGGTLAPNGRIYMAPRKYANYTSNVWHYIDTINSEVVAYSHGVNLSELTSEGYAGSTLASDGRIYLAPALQSTMPIWHCIDPYTNRVISYTHNLGATMSNYSLMSVVSTTDRVFFIPYNKTVIPEEWYYIQTNNTYPLSKNVLTSPYFNKY